MDHFFNTLGHFVICFADFEVSILRAFWQIAGVPDRRARAIFAGVTPNQAFEMIGRIADADEWSAENLAHFKRAQKQFAAINQLRNALYHKGGPETQDQQTYVKSNRQFALTDDQIKNIYQITPDDLGNACHDMDVIEAILTFLTAPEGLPEDKQWAANTMSVRFRYVRN